MPSIGPLEIVIILFIALMVFVIIPIAAIVVFRYVMRDEVRKEMQKLKDESPN